MSKLQQIKRSLPAPTWRGLRRTAMDSTLRVGTGKPLASRCHRDEAI